MKKLIITLITVVMCLSVFATWSEDPAMNLNISNSEAGSVLPKIVQTENGVSFYTWFEENNGLYNVRMQKVDENGDLLWGDNGILISDNESMTWLTDFGITLDSENNIIVTFQDIRTGFNDIFLYKISPDGEFLFGENGIAVTNTEVSGMSPTVEVNSNNDIFVGWMEDAAMKIKSYDSEGNNLAEIEYSETDLTYAWPQFIKTGTENIIVKYYEQSGPYWAPEKHILAQKFNANLENQWEYSTIITNAGGIAAWTQILSIAYDYDNGFYIAWHEDRDGNQIYDAYIQHINFDGEILLEDDGIHLSGSQNTNQFNPKIATTENGVYAFWSEQDGDQNGRGISAQYITDSILNWGENGKEIIALGNTDPFPISAVPAGDDFVIFSDRKPTGAELQQEIIAIKLDSEGNFVWEDEEKLIASNLDSKLHYDMSSVKNNQCILTWEGSDPAEIYAQNLVLTNQDFAVVSGNVYGESLEEPVVNALVTMSNFTTQTDENGFFSLDVLDGQTYDLTIEATNYEPFIETDLEISGDYNIGEIFLIETGTDDINNKITLGKNYPNPFNIGSKRDLGTNIKFYIPENSVVNLSIFNIKGQLIKNLVNQEYTVGEHTVNWKGTNLNNETVSTGIYFYKLETNNNIMTKKLLLVK